MHNAKRVVAATVLGVPLLLGAPGMAMAGGDQHGKPPVPTEWLQVQNQENATEQANSNTSPIHQFSVGSGDPAAMTWNNQANENATEQNQDAEQEHGD
ncbi:hypothetical protein [Saccharopolyspora sp. NPDC049357]|uniref:hypothetical protein n=1 Tax=Saccharopolyspora sp. NPDC049357 TaxID=3154507 RepID=UPI00343FC44E